MSNKLSKANKPHKPPKPHISKKKTFSVGTATSILGLIVGVAALVALRPQLEVSPTEALARGRPLTIPFRVKNTGLLSIPKVRAYFYINRLDLPGVMSFQQGITGDTESVDDLDPGESRTILFGWDMPSGVRPTTADIAVIAEYSALWIPFKTFHRIFRFKGVYGNDWQWQPQPSAEIADDVDKALKRLRR